MVTEKEIADGGMKFLITSVIIPEEESYTDVFGLPIPPDVSFFNVEVTLRTALGNSIIVRRDRIGFVSNLGGESEIYATRDEITMSLIAGVQDEIRKIARGDRVRAEEIQRGIADTLVTQWDLDLAR